MIILVDYALPSTLDSTRDAATVGLSTNLRRRVRFHGLVREHGFILRIALRALGEAIWSNDSWIGQSDLLDPVLMTEAPRQPVAAEGKLYHVPTGPRVCVQGAPTSPGLCNAILLRLDRRLSGLARKHGFAYTRYADDLSFSGDDAARVSKLMKLVPQIVAGEGFTVNAEKTASCGRAGARPSPAWW
jgi:reverse transcriptase-like protein